MAPKAKGGRGQKTAQDKIAQWRRLGFDEGQIRSQLVAEEYPKARISQLLKAARNRAGCAEEEKIASVARSAALAGGGGGFDAAVAAGEAVDALRVAVAADSTMDLGDGGEGPSTARASGHARFFDTEAQASDMDGSEEAGESDVDSAGNIRGLVNDASEGEESSSGGSSTSTDTTSESSEAEASAREPAPASAHDDAADAEDVKADTEGPPLKRRRLNTKTSPAAAGPAFPPPPFCPGTEAPCVFSLFAPGTAAVVLHERLCPWCDERAVGNRCRNAPGRAGVVADLRTFWTHSGATFGTARSKLPERHELVALLALPGMPRAFGTKRTLAAAFGDRRHLLRLCKGYLDMGAVEQALAYDMLTVTQREALEEAITEVESSLAAAVPAAKYCQGAPRCCFGAGGKRAQPHGPPLCLFCSTERLNASFLDRMEAENTRNRFDRLTPAARSLALERIRDEGNRQWVATPGVKRCEGREEGGQPCIFALAPVPGRAQVHGKRRQCLFCNDAKLRTKCSSDTGRRHVAGMLARMSTGSRRRAIHERIPEEHREAFHDVEECAEPRHLSGARLDRSWAGQGPHTPEALAALYEAGQAAWVPVLAKRSALAAPAVGDEEYRAWALADRAKSLTMMHVPHTRHPRGGAVSNADPLPKANTSRLAANLQLWCEFNSWGVCKECGSMIPRDLTPAALDGLLDPWCQPSQCSVCNSKQTLSVPSLEAAPGVCRGLSVAAREALRPVEPDFGPEIRSTDARGQWNGYREHSAMVTFAWAVDSVEDRIHALPEADREQALRVLRWHMRHAGEGVDQSAYAEFYNEHHDFLARNPHASDRKRKRWLRFLEREGLECALWPDLFTQRQDTLTWVRMQRMSRQVAAHGSTLEERFFPGEGGEDDAGEAFFEDYTSTKRAFAALALAPALDYGASYELLHFAYDLNLWTAIGSKKNKGLAVPMRLLMRGHSFSEEYWKDLHHALVDLVRQQGYPPVFSTRSPLEWSWPYHAWVVDGMAKMHVGRMHYPLPETLHQAHLLVQIGKNFVAGHNKEKDRAKSGHAQQLLKRKRADGACASVASFVRLEFQDGKRREATQDYHGTGRPHSHQLDFVSARGRGLEMAALHLEECVLATGQTGDPTLDGYVRSSQEGRQEPPWPVHDGPSHFDPENDCYVLHHTQEDHDKGIRGYYKETMAVTKCHEDVQVCGNDENYTAYVTAYAPKFSDSLRKELLNDDADADCIAASVLFRYKPCEPEMALQLFGARFRQWQMTTKSGGKRSFTPPMPDDAAQPREVRCYEKCTWRSESMCLLEFLRKSNNDGGFCKWLVDLWRDGHTEVPLQDFANAYEMHGEKVVACDMLSRKNDRFFGQWLLLHVPFRRVETLVPPGIGDLVPATDRYMSMCLASDDPYARRFWASDYLIDEDMKAEARTRSYREQILRQWQPQMMQVRKYLDGTETKPEAPVEAAQVLRSATKTHKLPIQRRYAQYIEAGEKTVEGRINKGAAARVMEGDLLDLGGVLSRVAEVRIYTSFALMLRDVSVEAALPDVHEVGDGVAVYHAFPGYATDARLFGVRAFFLAPPREEEEGEGAAAAAGGRDWNREQQRWLDFLLEDLERAAAVQDATSEKEGDEAREAAYRKNKIRGLEGPPGAGKTTVAMHAVGVALGMGLKGLWTTYTAQQASRMRALFGGRVDVNTCHAALGFDEDVISVGNALAPYGLVVVDEFQQLEARHLDHIDQLRSITDRAAAFALIGDRYQMAGFGEERVWHSPTWRLAVHKTDLHHMFRCKDPAFKKILNCLRTAKPSMTGARGGTSVPDIMRHRRAWKGHAPKVADVRRILVKHPDTTFLAIARRNVCLLDGLCIEAKFPRRAPLAVIDADVESNPENYNEDGRLKGLRDMKCTQLPLHEGMQVYFTRNVDKARDFVNGMRGTVVGWDSRVNAVQVQTLTNHVVWVYRWTDAELGNKTYFPIKAGYATTILKVAGAELPHVTLWLDVPHVPGAAYTGMSRVAYGRDLLIGGNLDRDYFTPAR